MICIAGKNSIAVNALYFMLKKYPNEELVVILNSNDPGYDTWQPSLGFHAKKNNINIINLDDAYQIANLIFLSLEFDKIIDINKFKTTFLYNIHFSLLPRYKGMYTSVLPIINGEKKSGVTLHCIDNGIDTGDIIAQYSFPININDTGSSLYNKYLKYSFLLFKKNIKNIINNDFKSTPQKSKDASYYSKKTIDFDNIVIDYNKTAFEIHNQIRAFTFRNYQLIQFNNFDIKSTCITDIKSNMKPGKIIVENSEYFELSTIDYNIRLYKDYYSIFWRLIKEGNLKKIKTIIKYIEDVNLKNKNGWNAIIIAVFNNKIEIVKWLLKNGADVNSINYKGTNLLMYAKDASINHNDIEMFNFILKEGISPYLKDNNGLNLFDYLKHNQVNSTIVKEIKELIND